MRALVVAIVLAWLSPPGDACSVGPRSVFRVFDEADTVALVHAYTVKRTTMLHVIQTFKGKPGKTIVLDVQRQTTCSPDLHGIGIIFLPKERAFIALNAEVFWNHQPFIEAVSTYAAAKTATARARVLVDFVNTRDAVLPSFAADALAEDPEALVALTANDRERLLRLLPRPPSMLPVVLARLGIDATQLSGDAAVIAKNRVFEDITDKAKLADIIAATPPKVASLRAAAALERCERLRGKRLNSFPGIVALYTIGHDWNRLADACRN